MYSHKRKHERKDNETIYHRAFKGGEGFGGVEGGFGGGDGGYGGGEGGFGGGGHLGNESSLFGGGGGGNDILSSDEDDHPHDAKR